MTKNSDSVIRIAQFWFGQIDSRPIALFRIIFGLLLLKDALYHLPLAYWFYSDRGVTPRWALEDIVRKNRFSLMDAIDTPWMAEAFFLAWIIVLVMFVIGWHTRIASILNFIFIVSVHDRNIFVIDGADNVFRILSFWMMFLPLAQHYAIDSLRWRWHRFWLTRDLTQLRPPQAARTTFAFPLRMIQLQIAMIYLFTFLLKLPGKPWLNGDALYYALQLRSLTLPTGDLFLQNAPAWLLTSSTYYVMFAEGTFIWFVFAPIFQPYLRAVGLINVTLFHTGVALLMSVPNFSALMISTYILFILPGWLDRAYLKFGVRPRGALSINLPQGHSPVWLLLMLTRADYLVVNSSVVEVDSTDTLSITDDLGARYEGTAAWNQITYRMPFSPLHGWLLRLPMMRRSLWLLGGQFVPIGIDGLLQPAIHSTPSRHRLRQFARVPLALFLGTVMILLWWWNLNTVVINGQPAVGPVTGIPAATIQYLSIGQRWNMFSPFPRDLDGWIIAEGYFEDGRHFNLLTGEAPDQQSMVRRFYGYQKRWQKYEENLYVWEYESLLLAWGRYLCRHFNDDTALPEGQRLASLDIMVLWRVSVPPGETAAPYSPYMLWSHWCFDEYAPQ